MTTILKACFSLFDRIDYVDIESPVVKCNNSQYFTNTGSKTSGVQLGPTYLADNSDRVPTLVYFIRRSNNKYEEVEDELVLPMGETQVRIEASDGSNNKASCNYVIRVTGT